MQTFLPYDGFIKSGMALDYRRLGKQRVEAYQILRTLRGEGKMGWQHHPAVKMWQGYEDALAMYHDTMIMCWLERGYKNNMKLTHVSQAKMPPWMGDPQFHASHRSNLLRKDPVYYGQFGWTEPPDLPYVWPVEGK